MNIFVVWTLPVVLVSIASGLLFGSIVLSAVVPERLTWTTATVAILLRVSLIGAVFYIPQIINEGNAPDRVISRSLLFLVFAVACALGANAGWRIELMRRARFGKVR